MKTKRTNRSTVIIGTICFSILTACWKGSGKEQEPVSDNIIVNARPEVTHQTAPNENGGERQSDSVCGETCPVDPSSPYWYDPNQDEVTFSDDGHTLLRFPRIKKGGDYVVPATVRYIEERAFQGCRNLKSLTIPQTVLHIEMAPFESCGQLEKLVLHCKLGRLPFRFAGGCSSLHDIFLADEKPPFVEDCNNEEEEHEAFNLNFYSVNTESCTIHVPQGSADLYRSAPVWRMFKHFVEI
jgi:hypothetical protein